MSVSARTTGMLLALVCLGLGARAQIRYEQGYFVTRDGKRTDCQILLKNADWRDNPTSFDYRTSETSESLPGPLSEVQELGVNGTVFRRYEVQMDRSSDDLNRLNKSRAPVFAAETLFLRMVVNGKASLFQYDEGNLHRFFFSVNGNTISQLVYKRYLVPNGEVTSNEDYKQQLFNNLVCPDITRSAIEKLRYEADDLMKFFVRYNQCSGGESVSFEKKERSPWPVHLNIRPGVGYNAVNIKNISFSGGGTANIDAKAAWRLGLEVEGILPFGNGLLSLFGEASYSTFSGSIPQGTVKVDYSAIEFWLGARKYFPVGSGKLYVSGNAVIALPQSSTVTLVGSVNPIKSTTSLIVSAGYKANRISGEIFYGLARNLLSGNGTYEAIYSGPGILVGYRLF